MNNSEELKQEFEALYYECVALRKELGEADRTIKNLKETNDSLTDELTKIRDFAELAAPLLKQYEKRLKSILQKEAECDLKTVGWNTKYGRYDKVHSKWCRFCEHYQKVKECLSRIVK